MHHQILPFPRKPYARNAGATRFPDPLIRSVESPVLCGPRVRPADGKSQARSTVVCQQRGAQLAA
jgi:hypothetical protein